MPTGRTGSPLKRLRYFPRESSNEHAIREPREHHIVECVDCEWSGAWHEVSDHEAGTGCPRCGGETHEKGEPK